MKKITDLRGIKLNIPPELIGSVDKLENVVRLAKELEKAEKSLGNDLAKVLSELKLKKDSDRVLMVASFLHSISISSRYFYQAYHKLVNKTR